MTEKEISLRQAAAELHDQWQRMVDLVREARDEERSPLQIENYAKAADRARENYASHCEHHGFWLREDASGLFVRCHETGIPITKKDRTVSNSRGETVILMQEAA